MAHRNASQNANSCHVPQVSMTMPLSRQRAQVAIPAQGMIEIRDALTDLLNEFGCGNQG